MGVGQPVSDNSKARKHWEKGGNHRTGTTLHDTNANLVVDQDKTEVRHTLSTKSDFYRKSAIFALLSERTGSAKKKLMKIGTGTK